MIEARFICILCLICFVKSMMEPFVVGGNYAHISHFPHSAFMSVHCIDEEELALSWICGSSIVNQVITLTAAHCLFGCGHNSSISVSVGHSHRDQGVESTVHSYLIHEDYDVQLTSSDIALVRLNTRIKFSENVKRVVLLKNPPYFEKAQIAGWGLTDEIKKTTTDFLKFVDQFVWTSNDCKTYVQNTPKGTICASSGKHHDYSTRGDSGSALVVRGYIQIGIVSYKMPSVSRSLVVYTDTGYFYDWIRKNSKKLYCVIEQT